MQTGLRCPRWVCSVMVFGHVFLLLDSIKQGCILDSSNISSLYELSGNSASQGMLPSYFLVGSEFCCPKTLGHCTGHQYYLYILSDGDPWHVGKAMPNMPGENLVLFLNQPQIFAWLMSCFKPNLSGHPTHKVLRLPSYCRREVCRWAIHQSWLCNQEWLPKIWLEMDWRSHALAQQVFLFPLQTPCTTMIAINQPWTSPWRQSFINLGALQGLVNII